VHAGVIRREDLAKMRLSLNERGLLRLQGRWHDFPSTGEGRVPLAGAVLDGRVVVGNAPNRESHDEASVPGAGQTPVFYAGTGGCVE